MVQDPPAPAGPSGVYLHIPFCSRRCTYCDFPTEAGKDDRIGPYLHALQQEIVRSSGGSIGPVDSVFLGGGTPSRLTGVQVRNLLDTLRSCFDLLPGTEITMESNPEDLNEQALDRFLEAGINRLTLGIQSLDSRVLNAVGRGHDGRQALSALRDALRAGFRQVGVDLIAGLPGEDPAGWRKTLERVLEPGPHHVSVYLLEMDKDTPLTRSFRSGRTVPPNAERLADDWVTTVEILEQAGYRQYEISNFARRDRSGGEGAVCRHNLKYWTDRYYAGFGLGAHGYLAGERRSNTRDLERYLQHLERREDPVETVDKWDPVRRVEEALFMGLRRNQGIDLPWLSERYGVDLETVFAPVWERGEKHRLLSRNGRSLCLTREGMLRSNRIFVDLLGRLDPLQS